MNDRCFLCSFDDTTCFLASDVFYARFDDYPVTPGHFIIFPRRHIPHLSELDEELSQQLVPFIQLAMQKAKKINLKVHYQKKLSQAIDEKMQQHLREMLIQLPFINSVSGHNIGINDGQRAGQSINHLHVHVMPRRESDNGVGTGGVRFVFPKLADYTACQVPIKINT